MSSEPRMPEPFLELGLSTEPVTQKDIKRAYAQRLKTIDAATDPEAFQILRANYENALRYLEITARFSAPSPQDKVEPEQEPPAQHRAVRRPAEEVVTDNGSAEDITATDNSDDTEASSRYAPAFLPEEAAAREYCQEQFALFNEETSASRQVEILTRILLNSQNMSREDHEALGYEIARYLSTCIEYTASGQPRFEAHITNAFLQLLDLHFQWHSDVMALERATFQFPETGLAFFSGMQSNREIDYEQPATPAELNIQNKFVGICVFIAVGGMITSKMLANYPELSSISRGISAIAAVLIGLFISGAFFRKLISWIGSLFSR